MMRCHLECSTTAGKVQKTFTTRSHWHCCLCPQLFERNSEFVAHLKKHENSSVASSKKTCKVLRGSLNKSVQDTCTVSEKKVAQVCPQCLKVYANSGSLQRHIKEVHKKKREGAVTASKYLNGVCVDIKKGIFMVRRNFSGVLRPVHCQHSTHGAPSTAGISACELDDCREAARVAKQSGHPAFECVHLQSVQYAHPYILPESLSEQSLNDLVGQKLSWFKESRRQACLSLKDKADEGGHPLIVDFPNDQFQATSRRFRYFSVYVGAVHYWSRFGRVIVGFDTLHSRWMCACCRSKVNCVHKGVTKWYIYQCEPSLLSDVNEEEDSDDGLVQEDESGDDFDEDPSLLSKSVYPPNGAVLEEMVRYLHTTKRLPTVLPLWSLDGDRFFPRSLIPSEEVCHLCHSALSDPRLISNRARIIGLTKVLTGACFKYYI